MCQNNVETLEEKNRQLIEMLERDFSDQLVYYSESSASKELIFPLNTLKPGEHEKSVAESLRHSIESSGAKEVQVPIWSSFTYKSAPPSRLPKSHY